MLEFDRLQVIGWAGHIGFPDIEWRTGLVRMTEMAAASRPE
jgi:hypothetical protein